MKQKIKKLSNEVNAFKFESSDDVENFRIKYLSKKPSILPDTPAPNWWSMILCPNSPLLLPIPFGKASDLDCIKIAVEAIAEAHKKITFALYSITSAVSESITLTPVSLFIF